MSSCCEETGHGPTKRQESLDEQPECPKKQESRSTNWPAESLLWSDTIICLSSRRKQIIKHRSTTSQSQHVQYGARSVPRYPCLTVSPGKIHGIAHHHAASWLCWLLTTAPACTQPPCQSTIPLPQVQPSCLANDCQLQPAGTVTNLCTVCNASNAKRAAKWLTDQQRSAG